MKKTINKYCKFFEKNDFVVLVLILFLAFILRWISVSGNSVFFYFDQARDATTATEIVKSGDLKIMGPSVSGTNDSVYHGVLYYYLIAPVYALFGSPYIVSIFLGFVSLAGIYITYLLGKEVFKSQKTGLIAALMQAVSVLSIQQSTWLSNPTLSIIFIPLTYLFIWKIFLSGKKQKVSVYLMFGFSLAMAMQSALQNITLIGSVLTVFGLSLYFKKYRLDIKKLFVSVGVFLVGISSMILTEVLMFKRDILSVENLNLGHHSVTLFESLPMILSKYVSTISLIIMPYIYYAPPFLLLAIYIIYFSKLSKRQILWSLISLFAPVWLLLWHYRDPNHTFIGIEVVIFLVLAQGIKRLLMHKKASVNLLAVFFILGFMFFNLKSMFIWKENGIQYFGIQKGALMNEQLRLIDKTYQIADGKEFSFSSLTAPYQINTTWNYLYQWYGMKKYGYVPSYMGIDQIYFVGDQALPEMNEPANLHFVIAEPDTTLSDEIIEKFSDEQKSFFDEDTPIEHFTFGTLRLTKLSKNLTQ